MKETAQYAATGRRKNSIARVRLVAGDGKITVNGRPFEAYFPRESNRLIIMQPLELVKMESKFNIFINVCGGGLTGQAGAVKLAIARALNNYDASLRSSLKKAKFLVRDARKRERKKYGRKRARRRFQYTKR
ncbi:MAG: 30S ribosomal protein S9 [Candidatus Omnitrophica bacterium]|nr:30S ribosomal protein S9 [Candidatus Omnitrophota bacterium]